MSWRRGATPSDAVSSGRSCEVDAPRLRRRGRTCPSSRRPSRRAVDVARLARCSRRRVATTISEFSSEESTVTVVHGAAPATAAGSSPGKTTGSAATGVSVAPPASSDEPWPLSTSAVRGAAGDEHENEGARDRRPSGCATDGGAVRARGAVRAERAGTPALTRALRRGGRDRPRGRQTCVRRCCSGRATNGCDGQRSVLGMGVGTKASLYRGPERTQGSTLANAVRMPCMS